MTASTHCPYRDAGYASRKDYLDSLAEEYGADAVYALASVLPPSEDFDGLVSGLEDFAEAFNWWRVVSPATESTWKALWLRCRRWEAGRSARTRRLAS